MDSGKWKVPPFNITTVQLRSVLWKRECNDEVWRCDKHDDIFQLTSKGIQLKYATKTITPIILDSRAVNIRRRVLMVVKLMVPSRMEPIESELVLRLLIQTLLRWYDAGWLLVMDAESGWLWWLIDDEGWEGWCRNENDEQHSVVGRR